MAKVDKKTLEVKTIYGPYKVVLEKDDKGYVVTAPVLPGVVTWGKNIKHAKKMAKEAVELCIECVALERVKEKKTSDKMGRVSASL